MKEPQKKEEEEDDCLNSISFFSLGVIVFLCISFSIVLNVICLIFTSWKYLKSLIKCLNIICLVLIGITLLISIIMFCLVRRIEKKILNCYKRNLVLPIILIILFIIIVIFNIINAIYLSINLHIADYPEYGGRKRDQAYIDTHPDEFGNVALSEFIIVAVCPTLTAIFNLLSIIIIALYRSKIVLLYNKTYEEKFGRKPDDDIDIKIHKDKDKKNDDKNRKNSKNDIKSSNDEISNDSEANPEHKKVKKEELIQVNINNSQEEYEKELPKKFYFGDIKFDTKDVIKEPNNLKDYNKELPENFYYGDRIVRNKDDYKDGELSINTPKRNLLNSSLATKTTLGNKRKNN